MGFINCGFATLEEIRNALIEFKKSGKIITSYSEIYTQRAYYIASVADSICIYPMSSRTKRLKYCGILYQCLGKNGCRTSTIRHGEFKSAVEPFMNTKMSDASRKQVKAYMSSIWQHYLENLAVHRQIRKEDLSIIVENLKVKTPKDALELGLVDHVFYKDHQNYFTQWMEVENYKDVKFIITENTQASKTKTQQKSSKRKNCCHLRTRRNNVGRRNETVIGSEQFPKPYERLERMTK